ncbi:hypothetical protein NMG60_11030136 [Bertholletia excelsa]
MGGATLPPGFRFHPTDEELIGYYLKRKVEGLEIELEVIPVIDLYKFDPWELPEKSFLPNRDLEWFFFCPRDKKYPNGSRTNRATKSGYWKATGKDRKVACQSSVTGYRKTLVFYRGRAPAGDRMDWVMHEYRLCDDLSSGPPSFQGAYALCRVTKKNDNTQKISDDHGEPKAKQLRSNSTFGAFSSKGLPSEPILVSEDATFQTSHLSNGSSFSSTVASPYHPAPIVENETFYSGPNPGSFCVSPDFILDSSKEYQHGQGSSGYFPRYEFPNSMTQWPLYNQNEISSSSSYSNFAEEVELGDDLSQFGGCMSPYSGHMNYMGFCGNEDMPYEDYDDQARICRQSSGGENFRELAVCG